MTATRKVGLFEAKTRLSALVEEARQGAEIEITRRGEPVAKIVPIVPAFDREKAKRSARRLLELRRGCTLGPGLTIKDLINEGRKY
jgi:prevent-host-death family protein